MGVALLHTERRIDMTKQQFCSYFVNVPKISLLYNGYQGPFPGAKQPGHGIGQPLPSSADVKKKGTAIPVHTGIKRTIQHKDRTVCNGRPRNISHQYTECYEVVTINVVKPRVKVR